MFGVKKRPISTAAVRLESIDTSAREGRAAGLDLGRLIGREIAGTGVKEPAVVLGGGRGGGRCKAGGGQEGQGGS